MVETDRSPFELLACRDGARIDTSQIDIPTIDEAIRIGLLLQEGGCAVIIRQVTPHHMYSLEPDGTLAEI
jgi:hypothetical protein